MFKLHGVTLLQPEQLVSSRVPGGAEAIGTLLATIQSELDELYATHTTSGGRSLCIALGPEQRLQLWLATEDEPASPAEREQVRALAERLRAPQVVGGPVAMALVFSIGDEAPPEAQLTLPDEWRAIVQASDQSLNVEQILTRLWA